MKKVLLALALVASAATISFAQTCTPDPQYTNQGVGVYPKPDTLDTKAVPNGVHSPLPCATVGVPYSFTFTAVIPSTVTVGGNSVPLNKVEIKSIDSLPTGIAYVCNPANCIFNGGMGSTPNTACVKISGTPAAGSNTGGSANTGRYSITVNAKVTAASFITLTQHFPSQSGDPLQVKGRYTLSVITPGGTCPVVAVGTQVARDNMVLMSAQPNPTAGISTITISTTAEQDVIFNVTNLAGQSVARRTVHFNEGYNVIEFDASTLAGGVYFYTIDNSRGVISGKLVVTHD